MRHTLFSLLASATIVGLMAPSAFAAPHHNFYGHITDFVDQGANGDFYIMVEQCDGVSHKFEFGPHANRSTWRDSLQNHIDNDHFIQIRAQSFFVDAMANVAGGTCENLDLILEARGITNFESDVEVNKNDHHGPRMHLRTKLATSEKERVHTHLKSRLAMEIYHKLRHEGDVDREDLVELKTRLKKRARFEREDRDAEALEDTIGLRHLNPIRLRALENQDTAMMHPIRMKGKYIVRGDFHVLVNPSMQVLAQLTFDEEEASEYESLVGSHVLVAGHAQRSEKTINVESIRELRSQDDLRNDIKDKWKAGVSLYHDIDTSDDGVWYTQYLDLLYDRGVFSGYSDGSFGGSNNVTLAEIAKVVSEAARNNIDADTDFSELSNKEQQHWAKKYLRHMKRYQLLNNLDDPNRPATRAEVIRAILKAYGMTEVSAEGLPDAFPDTDDAFVKKAYALGIIGGYDDGTFRPHAPINRAEVAKIVTLAIEMLEEDDGTLKEVEVLFDEVEDLDQEELEEWLEEQEFELESDVEIEGEVETH